MTSQPPANRDNRNFRVDSIKMFDQVIYFGRQLKVFNLCSNS